MHVGVVIAVGGFSPYLAEALDSVLAQSPEAVVVVDDGAREPLTLHPDHASRCTLVRRESRGGPAAARADGLAALSNSTVATRDIVNVEFDRDHHGEIDAVAICDADDAWEPGLLDALRSALLADRDAAVAFGRALVVGPDGRPTGESWTAPLAGPLADALPSLYAHNPIPTSSVLVRRTALDAAGGFAAPDLRAEDWDLWLRIARTGAPILCVPDARVRYRRHPGSLTSDVIALARAQRALHQRHGDVVPAATRDAALRADRRAELRARVRRVLPI